LCLNWQPCSRPAPLSVLRTTAHLLSARFFSRFHAVLVPGANSLLTSSLLPSLLGVQHKKVPSPPLTPWVFFSQSVLVCFSVGRHLSDLPPPPPNHPPPPPTTPNPTTPTPPTFFAIFALDCPVFSYNVVGLDMGGTCLPPPHTHRPPPPTVTRKLPIPRSH